jgi:hypothetical protein
MTNMDTRKLRASFREFVGHDRYTKFTREVNRACIRKGRLFFWMEELWTEFAAITPNAPQSGDQVIAAFSVCDVHDCPLQPSPDDRPLPKIRDTPEYEFACYGMFPFAICRDLVCFECRAAREEWVEANAELCSVLRCKTSYEDYCSRWLEGLVDRPEIKQRIKKRSTEIAAQMKPGDELWEWDAGGWHRLSGTGGVAIVRKGKIVKQWCELRS